MRNTSQIDTDIRTAWVFQLLETFFQDLRYGLRQLRRNPSFTVVAVITLALGIGANTAIFSVIDATLLRPLPYSYPDRLVDVSTFHLNGNATVIAPDFRAWQRQTDVFDGIGAFGLGLVSEYSPGVNLTGTGSPDRVIAVPVTVGFFHMLGVRPILGRGFTTDEGQAGHNQVALLSEAVWKRDLGGRRRILNQTIRLDGTPYTVVGVMPVGLLYPPGDIWVPEVLDNTNSLPQNADWPMLSVIGRLKPGVSPAEAQAALQVASDHLNPEFSSGRRHVRSRWRVQVVPLRQLLVGDAGRILLILLAAAGFVLLIACANLANLLLARAASRNKEMAVRSALGAGRWRLARQALSESLLLAFFGGCLGLVAGLWAAKAMKRLIPPELPSAINLDYRVLAFVIAVSVCPVIIFGVFPALIASRVDLNEALKEGGAHAGIGRSTHRLRAFLVMAETALALILLTGAGLMARSLLRLTGVELGFNPHHVLLGDAWLPITLLDQPQRQVNFFHEVLERLRATPGVEDAAATTHYPVSIFNALASGVLASGGKSAGRGKPFSLAYISPGYFQTMEIPLLNGRAFNNQDAAGRRDVATLSKSAARSMFGRREAVGNQISLDGPKGPWLYVVGVVADTRNYTLERQPWPEIFLPYLQQPSLFMTFVVRTEGNPMQLATGLRQAIQSVDRNQPVSNIQTMDDVVEKILAPRRFKLILLGLFALVALALAAVGLYGVIAFSVTERTHEIGIRVALGARKSDVLRLMMAHGLKLTLAGAAIGIAGAATLTRFLSGLLYGVKPTDPITFLAVSLILIAVALVASYIPARRATRVDPMVALRYE
jgi:putative ABC transport system permease protein